MAQRKILLSEEPVYKELKAYLDGNRANLNIGKLLRDDQSNPRGFRYAYQYHVKTVNI